MKFKIMHRKKLPHGWWGMNKYAAKKLHIPFKHKSPAHTIVVSDNQKDVKRTIKHEEAEALLMKRHHYSYAHAHRLALAIDKVKGRLKQNEL
jgi:hypothetical protein